MSTIVTRAGKGSPLTHNEVDANFTNLNTDKYQAGGALGTPASGNLANCTFPTLNQNTTGNAATATYATSAGAASTADNVPYSGLTGTVPTWNQDTTGNAATATYATSAGNASTVTNGVYTTNIGSTVLAYDSNLQSFVNTFTLPTTDSTDGYVLKTNGAGVLSFASPAAGTGTVTSVDMTVPTGLAVSGNPVTSSGTLAVTYASGYSIPTTTKQGQWDTAYSQMLQWDGGSTNLVAATGRTSLLPSYTGNAGKVLAVNAGATDVEYIAVGGTGTVTSVSGTGTVNGITLTGTVTSAGSLTLGGTLSGIGNSQLTNSSVTFNGQTVALGASGTLTANTTNALTIGTGLSGTSFDGSGAVTVAIDSTVATLSGTQTLSNKRVTLRIASITGAGGGVITPTSDAADQYNITALDASCSFAAPSGTPTDAQKLTIRIYSASAQTISSWDAAYRVIGTTLPTTSGAGKTIYVGCIWNAADSSWDVVSIATQA